MIEFFIKSAGPCTWYGDIYMCVTMYLVFAFCLYCTCLHDPSLGFLGLSDNIILNQTNHPRRFAFDLLSTERFYLCLIIVVFLFLFVFVRGGGLFFFFVLFCVCLGDFLFVCWFFFAFFFWGVLRGFFNIKFNIYTCRIQALTL